jgi:hypothetical protein
METKLTEQESFSVITEMINRARNNVRKGSANSIILNGYAVAIIAVVNFTLVHVLPTEYAGYSFYVWCLMFPVGFLDRYFDRKVDKISMVKTEIDKIIASAWRGFVISIIVFLVFVFAMAFCLQSWHVFTVITPVIMIMVALAEFVMAKACRFRPFFWGAVSFWAGALLCLSSYILFKSGDVQFLILAACMITGFVVPGYLLNKKAKEYV